MTAPPTCSGKISSLAIISQMKTKKNNEMYLILIITQETYVILVILVKMTCLVLLDIES